MKGYIVIEKINDIINLHYAKEFETAINFIKNLLPDIDVSYYDEETGDAWGENEFGQDWSVEIRNIEEDIDIL